MKVVPPDTCPAMPAGASRAVSEISTPFQPAAQKPSAVNSASTAARGQPSVLIGQSQLENQVSREREKVVVAATASSKALTMPSSG